MGCFFRESEIIPILPDLGNASEGKEENEGSWVKPGPFFMGLSGTNICDTANSQLTTDNSPD